MGRLWREGSPRALSRRGVLTSGAALSTLWAVSGCDALATDPATEGGNRTAGRGKAKESPQLTDLVEAGKLPPLNDRLPKTPMVVEPVEEIGVYGGTWTCATLGAADTSMIYRTIGYDQLMTWDREFTEPQPNVAEAVEARADGREFVIHLRPGLKWSDGEPFTAADVLFAFEDVYSNPELSPVFPQWLATNGEPGKVERIDDATLRFTFAAPHGWFLFYLAAPDGEHLTTRPRHYLEEFHGTYNPKVGKLAEEEGFTHWSELFFARADRWQTARLPTLCAWEIVQPLGEGTRVVAERNPFYWKTDPDGAQLPYLDMVTFEVANVEVMLLKASQGEFGMLDRHINTPDNKPVLAQGRDTGGYRFFDKHALPNEMVITLNLTHPKQPLREFFANKDARIGLSHAINRPEIIDTIFQQQGEPWQAAPRRESPLFDEEFANQFTEYDPDLANEYLDRAGYAERDADGIRLDSAGNRIEFRTAFAIGVNPAWAGALDLVAQHWKNVGVIMRPNPLDRSIVTVRRDANEHDAYVWWVGGDGSSAVGAMLAPDFYVPVTGEANYAVPWSRWYRNAGDPMEEPPPEVRQQLELYDKVKATLDPDEQMELFTEVLAIAKEQFYCLGIVSLPSSYGIVANTFHNVPKVMGETWRGVTPGRARPEQFFVEGATPRERSTSPAASAPLR